MIVYSTPISKRKQRRKQKHIKRFVYLVFILVASALIIYNKSTDSNAIEASFIPSFHKQEPPKERTPAPFDLTIDESYQATATKIDNFFERRFKKSIFNGAVLFAKDGKVVWKKNYGYKDIRTKEKLTEDSRFQIASVSKQFTAFAIVLLKQRGHLDYNDPVSKYIPGFPYKDMTIHHLLTHRSGIASYNYFADKYWKNKSKPMTNKDVVKMLVKNKKLTYFPVNKRFHYCNTNYALLAYIIEQITGMTYKDFMETQVFEPLHMYNTKVFSFTDTTSFKGAAKGHMGNNKLYGYNYQDEVTGDKGIYTTVDDMYIWDQYLYTNDFLKQSEVAQAFEPGGPWQGRSNYGYGWRLYKKKNSNDYYTFHFGWWHGYRSYFIRLPEKQGTIIILNNSMRGSFMRLGDLVALLD